MKITPSEKLSKAQKAQIIELWNTEYPRQLAYASSQAFDNYLNKLQNVKHFLLVDDKNNIKGWLMTFTREDDRWFAMIVDSSEQGNGFGTQLLNVAKAIEPRLNGWATDHNRYTKQNGETYPSPLDFYKKNGFSLLEDERFETEKLSALKIRWLSSDSF